MAKSLWVIPFGKHKGEPIEDVPSSYLEWLLEQEWFCDKPSYAQQFNFVQKELAFRERFSADKETEEDKEWNRR